MGKQRARRQFSDDFKRQVVAETVTVGDVARRYDMIPSHLSDWRQQGKRSTFLISGHLFVFRGGRGDLLKIIFWEGHYGSGACLFTKRLERGRFVLPIRDSQIRSNWLGMVRDNQ